MEEIYTISSDDELHHWGIKGQKWGIRRYQNKDGSLTPAGRKRYASEEAYLKEREKSIKNRERVKARQAKIDAKKAELDARERALEDSKNTKVSPGASKPKSVKDMTDAELDREINRARKEEEYRRLHPEPVAKPKLMNRIVDEVITPAAISSGKKALESAIDKAAKEMLKDKVDPNSYEALKKKYDTLKVKKDIDDLQNGKNDPVAKLKKEYDTLDYQQKINKLKKGSGEDQTIEDLLSKYGDMPEEERNRYQRASTVIGYKNTILGKKKDDK